MDNLTTETSASDGLVGYTGFLLVLASFTLVLGGVICCARIALMYCTFQRRREEELERARRTAATTTDSEQGLPYPRGCGIANHAFDDPPPRYDQVYKDDEPPPLYETLGNYGNVQPNSGAERRSSTAANNQTTGRTPETRGHERAPSYSVYIPPDSRSAPPRQDSVSDVAIPISTTSRQIQNYMEEVRERFSGNVDLFISSLSITTPPPTTEHRSKDSKIVKLSGGNTQQQRAAAMCPLQYGVNGTSRWEAEAFERGRIGNGVLVRTNGAAGYQGVGCQ